MPDQDSVRNFIEGLFKEIEARKERVCELKNQFLTNPKAIGDAELLQIITDSLALLNAPDFHQERDLDPFVEALSFSKRDLGGLDGEALKTAWSAFLEATSYDAYVEEARYDLIALWYFCREMWSHAVAVYEHVYRLIRDVSLPNLQEWHAQWVLQLWRSCIKRGLYKRAFELTGRLREYQGDGDISPEDYLEILQKENELRYRDQRDLFDRERAFAKKRLSIEHGPLLDCLDRTTREYVVEAELWSHPELRTLEPTAAPRRWALAVECEFHRKVFEPDRSILEKYLQGNKSESPLRRGQTCSVGQIAGILRGARLNKLVGAVFMKLRGSRDFTANDRLDIDRVIVEHRKQIAHVTEHGIYTPEECEKFVRLVRDSGWVFRFLAALQPR